MANLQIGVVGCAGRMGLNLLHQIHTTEDCDISGGSEQLGHASLGQDIGELAGLGNLHDG